MNYSSIKKNNSFIDTMHWIEYSNRNKKNDVPIQVSVDDIVRSTREERHYFLEPAVDGVINKISEDRVETSIKYTSKQVVSLEVEFVIHKYLFVNLMKIRRWSDDKLLRGERHAPFITYLQHIKPWPEPIPLYTSTLFNSICLAYSNKTDEERQHIIKQTVKVCELGVDDIDNISKDVYFIHQKEIKEEKKLDTRVAIEPVVMEKSCNETSKTITIASTLSQVRHALDHCFCTIGNVKRTVSLPGEGGDVIWCPKGFFLGCLRLSTMSPRWYLTSVYRERIPRDVILDLPKDESSNLFLSNVRNKGHLTFHGNDSIFALSSLVGYRGGVDVKGHWSTAEISYRCKSLLLDYREAEVSFNISVGDTLMHDPINQAYVRYPYFSYYDLHYEHLKSIFLFSQCNFNNVLQMYGLSESTFYRFRDVLAYDHIYVVKRNLVYYTYSDIKPDSNVDVANVVNGVSSFIFRRKGIVVMSLFSIKCMFNVVDSFVT